MLKKIIAHTIIFSCTLLAGCTASHDHNICDQLKRQWLYNTTNLNNEAGWNADSQKEALRQQLHDNHCI